MTKTKVIEFMLNAGDGGAETLVKDYALLMDREQFDVSVVVMHEMEDSANLRRLKEHSIPVIALSSKDDILKKIWRKVFWKRQQNVLTSEDVKEKPVLPGTMEEKQGIVRLFSHYLRNLYFGLRFWKVVRQTKADVIHGHLEVLYCMGTVSWLLKGVRLFHTCHSLPELNYEGREGRAARHLICKNGMQLIALHSDMAEQMDAMFPEQKTVVIRNGIDLEKFRNPGVTREEKRRELAIPQDVFLVGHVGRFTPEKNHPFLVEVFREIAERTPNAYLLMVGAGDHSHIEEMLCRYGLDGRYQILSGRKDINELLAAMDVFVFPSVFEGFGIALLEAQAAGLRCIASDCCPNEVFHTEECLGLSLKNAEKWAETALRSDVKCKTVRDLRGYDMRREIRRLEKLYLAR